MKKAIQTVFALLVAAFISNAAAAETMSVADVHAKRAELAGKQVTVSGTVFKVNNGIMHRNFIHVQDGTGSGDTDRVIFTSNQTAKVGDKVNATGTVKLDIDFGMGYTYATLVEESTIEQAK